MKHFILIINFAAIIAVAGCSTASQQMASTNSTGMSSASTMAQQIPSVGNAAGILGSAGTSSVASQAPSLIGLLVQRLGITPQQATGGAGSIFSLAKQSMSSSSFGQVSNAVPGMDQLLAAAPVLSGTGSGGLLGSAASALGGSSLGNMAALASSFQSLGLSSGMMNQFIPLILQYVQGTGGSSTMGLLQSAIMP